LDEEHKLAKVVKTNDIDPKLFGEGVTIFEGVGYALTWKEKKILKFDPESLEILETLEVPTGFFHGWGLTHDDKYLYATSGDQYMYKIDPKAWTLVSKDLIKSRTNAKTGVYFVNELEYVEKVNGEGPLIFGNVFGQS
jgi:glutamine cyclotransferase